MEERRENRGGRREGAGRKRTRPDLKRVQMVVTISPQTRDKIKAISKDKGIRVGYLLDELVKDL